jgi:DNA-binding transcriptional LysR family regulator
MELRHLRYFSAVAENQGFSRTARALHVSQSAISEQISDLEREIGTALLIRERHKIRLTPQGEVFLAEAKKVLEDAARAVDLTQRAGRGEIGTLRIGFFNGGTGSLVPKLIRDFRRKHPGVRVTVTDMVPTQQAKALAEGALDIGFTRPLDPEYEQQLRTELLYMDPLVAVVPRHHRLARSVVDLRSLACERFVLVSRETSSALFDKIIAACSQAGFSPQIVSTASVWSSVVLLVEAGEGIAILPSNLQQRGKSGLAFCPLRPPGASIELVLAWSPAREGPLQTAFLQLAREARKRLRHDDRGD